MLSILLFMFSNLSYANSLYSDVPDDTWYSKAVLSQDVMEGSNGKFRPLDNMTRAEFAVVASKLLSKIDSLEKEINELKSEKFSISDEQRVLDSIHKNLPSVVQIN